MKKKWNPKRAEVYLLTVAEDLIEDGMYAAEGGRLLHEIKYASGCETHHRFVQVVQHILEWDYETIGETLKELYK